MTGKRTARTSPPSLHNRGPAGTGPRAGPCAQTFQLGFGPPLLLIPSAFLRAASYRRPAGCPAADLHVNVVEMPGSGGSELVSRACGIAEAADWAATPPDALALPRSAGRGPLGHGGRRRGDGRPPPRPP